MNFIFWTMFIKNSSCNTHFIVYAPQDIADIVFVLTKLKLHNELLLVGFKQAEF